MGHQNYSEGQAEGKDFDRQWRAITVAVSFPCTVAGCGRKTGRLDFELGIVCPAHRKRKARTGSYGDEPIRPVGPVFGPRACRVRDGEYRCVEPVPQSGYAGYCSLHAGRQKKGRALVMRCEECGDVLGRWAVHEATGSKACEPQAEGGGSHGAEESGPLEGRARRRPRGRRVY